MSRKAYYKNGNGFSKLFGAGILGDGCCNETPIPPVSQLGTGRKEGHPTMLADECCDQPSNEVGTPEGYRCSGVTYLVAILDADDNEVSSSSGDFGTGSVGSLTGNLSQGEEYNLYFEVTNSVGATATFTYSYSGTGIGTPVPLVSSPFSVPSGSSQEAAFPIDTTDLGSGTGSFTIAIDGCGSIELTISYEVV